MHYDISGSGARVLLFIHGFGGFGGLWRWQKESFAPLARVITVDLPGHGKTPWGREGLEDMARDILGILDQEKITAAHLIGSSFGGLVLLTLIRQAPERAVSASLIGAPARFTPCEGFPGGLTVPGIRKMAHQLEGDVGAVLDRFVRSFSTDAERMLPQYARVKDLRRQAPLADRQALLAFLDILETADMRDVLRQTQAPLQILNGDQDYICPLPVVELMRRELPRARFDILEGAGHGPFVTLPDACNQLLAEFIGI